MANDGDCICRASGADAMSSDVLADLDETQMEGYTMLAVFDQQYIVAPAKASSHTPLVVDDKICNYQL